MFAVLPSSKTRADSRDRRSRRLDPLILAQPLRLVRLSLLPLNTRGVGATRATPLCTPHRQFRWPSWERLRTSTRQVFPEQVPDQVVVVDWLSRQLNDEPWIGAPTVVDSRLLSLPRRRGLYSSFRKCNRVAGIVLSTPASLPTWCRRSCGLCSDTAADQFFESTQTGHGRRAALFNDAHH